ncbi:hypothetical protein Bca52824_037044 [Brassica carinata]|uniref:Uncharacterized protein n=1 Tax=Brassica carinata TaxID=52824 RepID=A0A8X7V3B7_BRACI|nr:hypothetical protein Bca52824_037044 [Brassica carinata]
MRTINSSPLLYTLSKNSCGHQRNPSFFSGALRLHYCRSVVRFKIQEEETRGEIRRLRMVWIMRFSGLFSALLTVIDLSPQTMKDSVGTRLRSLHLSRR